MMSQHDRDIAYDMIIERYHEQDLRIEDFLKDLRPSPNMTFEDVLLLYVELMHAESVDVNTLYMVFDNKDYMDLHTGEVFITDDNADKIFKR